MTDKQFVYLKHPVSQEEKESYRKEGKTILDERFKPKGEAETPKKGGKKGGKKNDNLYKDFSRDDLAKLIVEFGGEAPDDTATDDEVVALYEALLGTGNE